MVAPFEVRADHASGESLGSESGEQDGDSFVPSGHPVVVGEDRARAQIYMRKILLCHGSRSGTFGVGGRSGPSGQPGRTPPGPRIDALTVATSARKLSKLSIVEEYFAIHSHQGAA